VKIDMVHIGPMTNIDSASGAWNGMATETTMAIVRRSFRSDGKRLKVGTVLSPEFVKALSWQARAALVRTQCIELMPVSIEIT
jgi:hypothetical protein